MSSRFCGLVLFISSVEQCVTDIHTYMKGFESVFKQKSVGGDKQSFIQPTANFLACVLSFTSTTSIKEFVLSCKMVIFYPMLQILSANQMNSSLLDFFLFYEALAQPCSYAQSLPKLVFELTAVEKVFFSSCNTNCALRAVVLHKNEIKVIKTDICSLQFRRNNGIFQAWFSFMLSITATKEKKIHLYTVLNADAEN